MIVRTTKRKSRAQPEHRPNWASSSSTEAPGNGRVQSDVEWLAGRCERVAVVAHAQGAAIAHAALTFRAWRRSSAGAGSSTSTTTRRRTGSRRRSRPSAARSRTSSPGTGTGGGPGRFRRRGRRFDHRALPGAHVLDLIAPLGVRRPTGCPGLPAGIGRLLAVRAPVRVAEPWRKAARRGCSLLRVRSPGGVPPWPVRSAESTRPQGRTCGPQGLRALSGLGKGRA